MFNQTYGSVTIKTEVMPKRGECLHISKTDGTYILADFCGMNPALVPDGTNAYFFGNKLIIVTRWADMTESEIETVENDEITLAVHPYQCVQLSIKIGENWGDVMTTLHNFSELYNDKDAPVDEIIFIFSDTHDSDYITARSVMLPKYFQTFLQKANQNNIQYFSLDASMPLIRQTAENDPYQDEFDLIYDLCYEKTKEFSAAAKKYDPSNIPDGIYITINSENEITDIHQHEFVEEVKISDEVKAYLKLAEMGIDDAQYNLGVCYEQGDGIAQDFEQAVYWYKKAAEQGNAKAQHNLGICIYNGYGAAADHTEAARLFRLSAEQGDMYAQYNLAVLLMNGDGVEKNVFEAIEWLQKAAKSGHPQAKDFVDKLPL
ncbi:MAG: sel1 repeat family protein [Clostridia bacterium]|nr:sel1 repeat family protein [Clostridia bacterium]